MASDSEDDDWDPDKDRFALAGQHSSLNRRNVMNDTISVSSSVSGDDDDDLLLGGGGGGGKSKVSKKKRKSSPRKAEKRTAAEDDKKRQKVTPAADNTVVILSDSSGDDSDDSIGSEGIILDSVLMEHRRQVEELKKARNDMKEQIKRDRLQRKISQDALKEDLPAPKLFEFKKREPISFPASASARSAASAAAVDLASDAGKKIIVKLRCKVRGEKATDKPQEKCVSLYEEKPVGPVFHKFCTRFLAVSRTSTKFMFDGEALSDHVTPSELDMESDDIIEVIHDKPKREKVLVRISARRRGTSSARADMLKKKKFQIYNDQALQKVIQAYIGAIKLSDDAAKTQLRLFCGKNKNAKVASEVDTPLSLGASSGALELFADFVD